MTQLDNETTRPFRRKVKSGCRTCKLRKVKCDEEWPVCRRCRAYGGRTCDGYGIWGGGSAGRQHQVWAQDARPTNSTVSSVFPPTLSTPLRLIPFEANEQSCFEWYMCRSAKKLPGAFYAGSWTELLVQASTEPAVRHAVLALGSAHRQEVQGISSLASESNDEQTLFTVRQYSKAITHLQPCFADSGRRSVRITLIACALFVYTEFLRGHYKRGLLHLEHGMRLLGGVGTDIGSQDPSSTYVDGWLLTVFTRHLVQAKMLGQLEFLRVPRSSLLSSILEPGLDTFRSCHHARRILEQIMLRIFSLQDQSREWSTEAQNELLKHQIDIQLELQIWIRIHKTTMIRLSSTHDQLEVFAYRLLILYYLIATILAGTCLDTSNESSFDQYQPSFLEIIARCIETYNVRKPTGTHVKAHHDPEPTSPNSVSDIGWIAPLHFTAIKCRNHRLRHQAVNLLRSMPHKEGIWSTTLSVAVARQVIAIEEGSFYDHLEDDFDKLAFPKEEELDTPTLPQERRLSEIKIVLPDDRFGKLRLSCRRSQRGGEVEWISKDYDLPSGQWNDSAWTTPGASPDG